MLGFYGSDVECGVDEVGRGCLFGPVVAAAVVLPLDIAGLDKVNDSKRVSKKNREMLDQKIRANALAVGIGVSDHHEVDQINVLQATFKAMQRAVDSVDANYDVLLIDGNQKPDWCNNLTKKTVCIPQGDRINLSIACASIVAKVYRDGMMEELATNEVYAKYDIQHNMGYATPKHIAAIREHGLTDMHRKTFSMKFIKNNDNINV